MSQTPASAGNAVRRTVIICAAVTASMLGVAFASVPLYNLFCRVTGFDGTPVVRSTNPGGILDRAVTVRFDVNVAPGLDWRFAPEAPAIEARLGETKTVFFRVRNAGPSASTGIATFNVQPSLAGAHFVKMQCFCFNDQVLQPGESMDFPVVFYIDPALATDPNVRDVSEITLSYTYFASRNATPVTAAAARPGL